MGTKLKIWRVSHRLTVSGLSGGPGIWMHGSRFPFPGSRLGILDSRIPRIPDFECSNTGKKGKRRESRRSSLLHCTYKVEMFSFKTPAYQIARSALSRTAGARHFNTCMTSSGMRGSMRSSSSLLNRPVRWLVLVSCPRVLETVRSLPCSPVPALLTAFLVPGQ